MATKYSCGVCDKDVTAIVLKACNASQEPVIFESASAGVRVSCQDGHLCDYACSSTGDVKGTPVPASAAEKWEAWLAYADPAVSMTRMSTYARWILTGNTLVVILAGALATIGVTKIDRPQAQVTYSYAIVLLGLSMVIASFALAPQSADVSVDQPEKVTETYLRLLRQRYWFVTIASVCFATALSLAARWRATCGLGLRLAIQER
jgi:hypothetical protein